MVKVTLDRRKRPAQPLLAQPRLVCVGDLLEEVGRACALGSVIVAECAQLERAAAAAAAAAFSVASAASGMLVERWSIWDVDGTKDMEGHIADHAVHLM